MDRKSIIALAACILALALWPALTNKIFPPKPLPPRPTNAAPAVVSGTNANGQAITTATATATAPGAAVEASLPVVRLSVNTNIPESLLELTNSDVRYVFTSRGGGIKEINLLRYPETVKSRATKDAHAPGVATLNTDAPLPAMSLAGGDALQGDGIYNLSRISNGVRAAKTLTNGLTVVKEFVLDADYLVKSTVRFENHAAQALVLPAQQWVIGTATPLGARDDGRMVGVQWFNGAKSTDITGGTYFTTSSGCSKRIPPLAYQSGATNVVWAAAHNQYFALACMPQHPSTELIVQRVDLPRITGEEARFVAANAPLPQGYQAILAFPAMTLTNRQALELTNYIYAGPKEYQTLARISGKLNNTVDQIMDFGWAGFVSKALLLGMNMLHETLRLSYGWAIVAITIIIKLVFWPLTRASTRSMKRMQALQPQMAAIKEKYKDDPAKMNQKTMEFMKEHKVNPMGGCLPMLIQIPVFFGFYQMIQSAIELRGASFLWVADLSKPDTLFIVPGLDFIPFFGIPGVGLPFNLLPLLMGLTMLWQAKTTPVSPGMDPAQAKMMQYMPLIFMVTLYGFSAGLTLYWTVNNLLTIAQTKLTKTEPEPAAGAAPALTAQPKKRK
jgi:YidC/Oxa1 family membrane protein insertase